jgi:hypothetical protein
LDREDDHGEEIEGEEEIHQKEGRSGAQEEENSEGGKEDHEESGEEGCSQAEGSGQEAGPGADARSRARARPVLAASAGWLWLWRQRQHLRSFVPPQAGSGRRADRSLAAPCLRLATRGWGALDRARPALHLRGQAHSIAEL